jgi:hypothetical protein
MSAGIRTRKNLMPRKTFIGALGVVCLFGTASLCFAADHSGVLGDWRGSSICLVKPSACHDEEALYHVKAGAKPGTFSMQADKIVDGKPEEMGTADCSYEPTKKLLHCAFARGYVDLTLEGDSLNGAMFLTDKSRWREIKLKKVK